MSKGPDIEGDIDVKIDAADINVDLNLGGQQDINMTTELKVPDPIHTKMELLLPQPLETKSSSELAITQPIVTEVSADLTMDVKPVVVDLCLTLSVGKLPRTCVRRQYDRHMGLTFFGVEVVGFNRSGESQFTLDELLPRSHVEPGGQSGSGHHDHGQGRGKRSSGSAGIRGTEGGGLAIRLDG
jgi:hypothetical protein